MAADGRHAVNRPHQARRRRHTPMNMRVSRPVYTEQAFQEGYEQTDVDQSLSTRLRKFASRQRCTLQGVKRCLVGRFPILEWLPVYDVRHDLLADVISGMTVGTMRIAQAMAYALLASLPPVYGLYVAFFSVIIYSIMGTSRHISAGTFAVLCIMTGNAVDRVLSDPSYTTSSSNDGMDTDNDLQRVYVASALAVAVGIVQLLMAILRLGFVTIYLSEPLVRGFTTGAAVHVFTSQFRHLFGVSIEKSTGFFALVKSYIAFFSNLYKANVAAIITSAITVAFLVAVNEVQDFIRNRGTHRVVDGVRQRVRQPRKKIPIPSELVVIIVGTAVSYTGQFADRYGMDIVGEIPTGMPPPRLPQLSFLGGLIGDAIAIAIVGYAVSISMAKIFAKKHKYEVDPNQELLAFGTSQIFVSFFNCFPVGASLSRSLVQEVSGGKTQLAGLISSIVVLLVLYLIGPLFSSLPVCCLASIIVVALAGMFRQFKDLIVLWQVSSYDFLIWMVTFLGVVLLGVDIGLALGVVFSLMTVIIRTQQPYCTLMGRIPGTDIYRDIKYYEAAEQIPGIRIFRAHSCLCFVNAEYFKNSLYSKVFKKKQERDSPSRENGHTIPNGEQSHTNGETPTVSLPSSDVNSEASSLTETAVIHTIIVDCSMFGFIDTVGLKTLHAIVAHCSKRDIQVVFASTKAATREAILQYFERCEDHSVGLDHMYLTLHDAVLHSQHLPATPTSSPTDINCPNTTQVATQASTSIAANLPVDQSETSV
ncbi:solute carrier family 26 member 10-like [Acanthaster planci]|uniref:Solute carrier family 26 member 10-like n=1 Tax=Acanthaster planci TaxID=133434 RepID=A0A8B7ZQH0_ACAPL|nr:solute carrier family 26 member 10-like [Acanthaster planci]XP_022107828.1 solute carrier family 26 member 10-like [Acanthaster planci]